MTVRKNFTNYLQLYPGLFSQLTGNSDKVNRCLTRYSPPTNPPTGHQLSCQGLAQNEYRNANFGPNWVVFGQKILFLLEKSKVLFPT